MKRLLIAAIMAGVAVMLPATAGANASATAPVSTSAPSVSGQPYAGSTLTAGSGGWSNGPTAFTFQWARCDAAGNGCGPISGATGHNYTPVSADVNGTLEAWVTASNDAGTTGPVNSKPTAVITPALPPVNSARPTVVGKPFFGETLVADPGSYSGGAVAQFAYEWQTCDPATLICVDVAAATGQSYTVAKTDVGQRLRVRVTASNPFGRTRAESAATDAIAVPVIRVTTTLNTSAATTICCQVAHLSGTVLPAAAGDAITILGRRYGALASYPVATATTDALGRWTAKVTPMVATTYTAQTTTSTSSPLTLNVHPRVGFGINGNDFSAKITGRDSFAGRVALFQRLSPGGSWHSLALVVIDPASVAHFHVGFRRGRTYVVRIYLPYAQAGAGYLDGTSHTRRVGGASAH
jgi:hypothetical protein